MTFSDGAVATVALAALGAIGKLMWGFHGYDKRIDERHNANVAYMENNKTIVQRIERKLDINTDKTQELLIESREHFASDKVQFNAIDKRLERLEP